MPLVRIDAQTTAAGGLASLGAALEAWPREARVTVMVHGYKYAPGSARRCPHRHILAVDPDPAPTTKTISWPRHLGVGADNLGIAFGWTATGHIWRAWREAGRAGTALAHVLDRVAASGRRADIVAHSLGARVALEALRRARAGAVGRVVLIAPAEFRAAADAALATPAGSAAEVLNVVSRENDVFDAMIEWLVQPHRPRARTLGLGLGRAAGNWTDLQIDDRDTLDALDRLGHRVAPPAGRICHWSGYLRPGLFPLYRAVLSGALPLPVLRGTLPATGAPRWSRLLEPAAPASLLPFARKAPL